MIGEGYTKTPNQIYEAIPKMGEAELRCTMALVRQTYGFHRDEARATYKDFMEWTGLSRQGVANGLDEVRERGFFKPSERRSFWKTVNLVDQNSQPSRPPEPTEESTKLTDSVNLVDQNSQPSRLSHPYKESNKEKKETSDRDEDFARAVRAYENVVGPVTPFASENIGDAVDELGCGWVIDAIRIADENSVRKWSYIKAILDRWRTEGRDNDQSKAKNGSGPDKSKNQFSKGAWQAWDRVIGYMKKYGTGTGRRWPKVSEKDKRAIRAIGGKTALGERDNYKHREKFMTVWDGHDD